MEKRISIPNKQETIEAYVDLQHQTHGIIIMHPHSLMGGNMDNPVVQKAQQIFARKGITTLRFNFRGVGNSTGCFGEGIGEQDDLIAVMDYLNSQGRNRLDLAGYSFGSWVMAHAVQKINDTHGIIMISPPVAFMDFSSIQKIPGLKHVITGSQDEFAPPNLIQSQLPHWQPDAQLHIIDGADHFFFRAFTNT
ncbi:MAG: alpha/beta hydrolase family protein [Candidatus Magnetoglobus multicellularis str. Araruama]|uniref:Alpha/beta hydrolase family protein n=1 Tax=Candidatus Magnetoglobus multicellularis str. Araruama TaxID=890399 RepID=A0A1V1NX47_9BACT|nr:MAG: alpha/beta hydrolase family protein [Candidatus Magnetoglobus multicellularis str. Araruama]